MTLTLPKLLLLYVITAVIFLSIDFLWLGLIAKQFYQQHIGSLLKQDINFLLALSFYLLYCVGIVIFVVLPSLETQSILQTLLRGMAFGLFTYATYDLTNQITLKNWSSIVTIVDIIWGMFITAVTSLGTYLIINKLFNK